MNQYLVPANSKKSRLIFGFFTPRDMVICGIGGGITIAALLIFKDATLVQLLLAITPLLLAVMLVFPVPHYHNICQLLINIFTFFTNARKYYWKGWCVKYDTKE